jgi:hypothetical protein
MAFPQTPLNVQVWIRIDGVLTNITDDVRTGTEGAITVKRGRADEGSRSDVGEMTFVLNNRDGKYSPRNPTSPYYGKIGRNTYCQLRVVENATTYFLFTGEISSWPQRWNTPGTDVWVPVTVSGVLRRLSAGASALESTLRRRIPSDSNLIAYWPFEDEVDTERVFTPLPNGINAQVEGFQFAQADGLPGTKSLPTLSASARMTCLVRVPPVPPTTWQVEMVYKLDAMPSTLSQMLRINTSGRVQGLLVMVGTNNIRLRCLDAEGATIDETNTTAPSFNGTWNRLVITGEQTGSSAKFRIHWIVIGTPTDFAADVTISNCQINRVSSVTGSWGAAFEGMSLGHLSVFNALSTIYNNADHGFNGERAITRIQRLCQEEGIGVLTRGTAARSAQMGPQRPNTLLALLEECADVDLGFLTERRDDVGLLYISPQFIYSTPSKLDLDYAANQVAPPLEPIDDDQGVMNDVTVQREGGSASRVVDETSAMSVLDPPLGVGRYDSSVTVNAYRDEQTADIAGWMVHLGTVDEARYPVVRFKLAAVPALLDAAEDIDVWNRMRVLNPPEWLPPDAIDLLTQGYTYTLGSYQWDMEFNCSPYSPYDIAILDDNSVSRADTVKSSVYDDDAGDTGTYIWVYTEEGPRWILNESLTENTTFEVDVSGWTGSDGGTVAWAATPEGVSGRSFAGSGSLKVTPDGVGAFPGAESDPFPTLPGMQLRVRAWGMCETTRSVDVNINWYDSNDNYLSTSTVSHALTANTWQFYDGTFTVPAGALFGRARPTVPAGVPADVAYFDNLTVTLPNGKSPDNFPFNIRVAGEKMTVLSVRDSISDTFTRTTPATVRDAFERTVANGWGSADTGQDWTTSGGSASDYSVSGGVGKHSHSTLNVFRVTAADGVSMTDVDLQANVSLPVQPAGDSCYAFLLSRANVAAGTFYFCRFQVNAAGAINLSIRKRTPTETLLVNVNLGTYTAGQVYTVRFAVSGTVLRAKAWLSSTTEPVSWQLLTTDADIAGPGTIGIRSFVGPSSTNPIPVVLNFDQLTATPITTGWNTTTSGAPWSLAGSDTQERFVDSGVGKVVLLSNPQTFRLQTCGDPAMADCEIMCKISVRQVATGAAFLPGIIFRYVDGSNFYRIRAHFNTDGSVGLSATYAGTQQGSSVVTGHTYTGTEWFWLHARVDGHRLRGRIWRDGMTMPEGHWHLDRTVTTTTIDTGRVGVSASSFAGNTNVNPVIYYDDFRLVNPQRFTVMRSQNGVVKNQTAGGDVRLFRPAIVTQ